jgi:hypothetical protein
MNPKPIYFVGLILAGGGVLSPLDRFAQVRGTSVTYSSDIQAPEDSGK